MKEFDDGHDPFLSRIEERGTDPAPMITIFLW